MSNGTKVMKLKALPKGPKAVHSPAPAPAKIRCPELASLPKSPLRRGVTYRHQSPGNPTNIIAPRVSGSFLDPAHPAVVASKQPKHASGGANKPGQSSSFKFPVYNSPTESFKMVAAPKAFLFEPECRWVPYFDLAFEKWEDKVAMISQRTAQPGPSSRPSAPSASSLSPATSPNATLGKGKQRQPPEALSTTEPHQRGLVDAEKLDAKNLSPLSPPYPALERIISRRKAVISKAVPVSLMFATNKARMGGKVFYASKMRKRVRAAVSLIVTHGAKAADPENATAQSASTKKRVVLDLGEVAALQAQSRNGWIMKDWTYLIHPTMKLYRMPHADLISELRDAFQQLYRKASGLEERWLADATGSGHRRVSAATRRSGGADERRKENQRRPRGQNTQ